MHDVYVTAANNSPRAWEKLMEMYSQEVSLDEMHAQGGACMVYVWRGAR